MIHATTMFTLADAGPVTRMFFRDGGKATYSAASDGMFLFLFWLSVVSFVGLMGAMFYFVAKYRWKPGRPVIRSASHNTPLEIAWTVIPTILLVFIFFRGFWIYAEQQTVPAGAIELNLTAYKWGWDITYPNGSGSTESVRLGAVDVPVFIVPEDTPIRLVMTSDDVIHSWWVPDFRMKQDVFPNRFTGFWFQSTKLRPGDRDNEDLPYPNREHWVFCAEYCGDNHSEMAAVLRVVPREEYAKWFAEPIEGGMSLVDAGALLYRTKGCVQCHSVDGSDNSGPTWLNMYGYEWQYDSGRTILMDDNMVRESIYLPGAEIRRGYRNQMPTYQGRINSRELAALIAYMKSLSDRGPDPSDLLWGDLDAQGLPTEREDD